MDTRSVVAVAGEPTARCWVWTTCAGAEPPEVWKSKQELSTHFAPRSRPRGRSMHGSPRAPCLQQGTPSQRTRLTGTNRLKGQCPTHGSCLLRSEHGLSFTLPALCSEPRPAPAHTPLPGLCRTLALPVLTSSPGSKIWRVRPQAMLWPDSAVSPL